MYGEGSGKVVVAIILAVILAISICYWHQTQFLLKFLWDLLVIDTRPVIYNLRHFHFGSTPNP
jgi:hypothetical protein